MCTRAAKIWGVDPEGVVWEDGHARPASSNVGEFQPLSFKEIAAKRGATGGPIVAAAGVNPAAVAPGFATQFCDVEVDPETGKVTILRFVAAQDVGRAIHPSYVEGQIQGGVVQGIGWALNEEYIYNDKGQLENAGFLDYRIPVASDLPMIETVMVEVPNPNHPYGAKGVARGQHLSADGGDRQRDRARDRQAADRAADVAAEGARRDRRAVSGSVPVARVERSETRSRPLQLDDAPDIARYAPSIRAAAQARHAERPPMRPPSSIERRTTVSICCPFRRCARPAMSAPPGTG